MDNAQLFQEEQKKKKWNETKWNKTRILQAKQDISTDIWIGPIKVTKTQTDYAIQSATDDYL